MAKYLFYRNCQEVRWVKAGPYVDMRDMQATAMGSGSEIIWLWKECATEADAREHQLSLEREDLLNGGQGNLNNPIIWRFGQPPATGPNYGISDFWLTRPWVGIYHAGMMGRNRRYWPATFTNGGEALRFAAKKIAEMPQDINGYQYYPRICCVPSENWMVRTPVIELITDTAPDNYATIKDYDVANLPAPTCGNCGFYGHRKDTCTSPPRAYDLVGIEIEGRWLDLNAAKVKALEITGGAGYQDGSVYRDDAMGADPWEFQTKPDTLRRALEQLLALYPDSADEKCGMHVHVSFTPGDTGLLTTKAFFDHFKEKWTKWGDEAGIAPNSEFWNRLKGKNNFCKPNSVTPGRDPTIMDRYAQINFASWGEHKTVECRLLPMFRRSSLAVKAITYLLEIYEGYLNQDFEATLPKEDVIMPKPIITGWKESREFPVEDYLQKHKFSHTIELNTLPAVAKGMRRVALPTGRTMGNLDGVSFANKVMSIKGN